MLTMICLFGSKFPRRGDACLCRLGHQRQTKSNIKYVFAIGLPIPFPAQDVRKRSWSGERFQHVHRPSHLTHRRLRRFAGILVYVVKAEDRVKQATTLRG